MFFVGEVVKPSGRGRTAIWEGMVGTVTRVEGKSVFVQWHDVCCWSELDFEEVISTGTFQKRVPHHARVLDGSDDAELVTFYDDDGREEIVVGGHVSTAGSGCRTHSEGHASLPEMTLYPLVEEDAMTIVQAAADYLWFLDTLVRVRVPHGQGTDGLSVLEHRAPWHDSPPLHIHHTEDELFQILDGEFRFRIGQDERSYTAGDILLTPKGVPHTYRVESPSGGRWITVTTRGDFERFVRAVSRPAAQRELPPPSGPPTPEAVSALADAGRQFGIELVGAPLH